MVDNNLLHRRLMYMYAPSNVYCNAIMPQTASMTEHVVVVLLAPRQEKCIFGHHKNNRFTGAMQTARIGNLQPSET